MKKLLFLFLCILPLAGCSHTPYESNFVPEKQIRLPSTSAHYYATALQEFIESAAGKTNATLYDLDACGNDEVIAFDVGETANSSEHWAEISQGGKITIFDEKNSGNTISSVEPEYGARAYWLYITGKNYLVLRDEFEGYVLYVYEYKDNVLAEKAVLAAWHEEYSSFYSLNGIECDESQFSEKLNEYDLENPAVTISIGDLAYSWADVDPILKDDTSEILEMTVELNMPTS